MYYQIYAKTYIFNVTPQMNATNVSLLPFLFLAYVLILSQWCFFPLIQKFNWFKLLCIQTHLFHLLRLAWFLIRATLHPLIQSQCLFRVSLFFPFRPTKDTEHIVCFTFVICVPKAIRLFSFHCHYYGTIKMKMKTKTVLVNWSQ